ncbi:WW domain binding protein 11-domain-containing protein [Mucidula mucida]|nr:WW domain binding protein 11-domain-containing protein [Mucidula mucida]
MAKKNLNPADSFRKAQRKKELKKNKATRSQARDFTLVKKDTWDLQDEIERLESAGKPDDQDKARLLELKAELEKINKKKAEWVAEHPEHRRLVYRPRKDTDTQKLEQELAKPKRNLFLPNGLPRHPERSVYYDPVMNPFGVAPPGMPYRERDLLPGEIDSDADSDDDDDIMMPAGPPPNGEDVVDSDEDIPMPEGPPPGRKENQILRCPHHLYRHFYLALFLHILPPNFMTNMPQPPPGFFPRGTLTPGTMQDPLSSIPYQTFQGHRSQPPPPPHSSLPPKPQFNPASSQAVAATVSAEPELRNLKKEATSFVPASLKRRKAGTGVVGSSRINAAPGVLDEDDAAEHPTRPDLLSVLKDQFGPAPSVPSTSGPVSVKPKTDVDNSKDDYAKFVEEMGDILGNK